MSTTILAPTPALPPVRRASVWGKMFGNFKMGKTESDGDLEMEPPLLSPNSPSMQKTRLASVSTGYENGTVSYKRNASVSVNMVKDSRSCSAPMPSPSTSRNISVSGSKARRSSRARRPSWWRSANPEEDEAVPAVPAIDRKYSMFGSHNPDLEIEENVPTSPIQSRRPSYVPRSAASSFLRTTTPLSSEEKAEVIRRASVADMRSASNAGLRSPVRGINRPTPLSFNSDSLAKHGMSSMAGVCEIVDVSDLVSPRGNAFPVSPGPLSPTDTIMEEQIDSAKASPELNPFKAPSNVIITELDCMS